MELTTAQVIEVIKQGDSLFAFIMRERALTSLAGVCDYAATRDNAGFNGTDAGFGHSLAEWISNSKKREGFRLSKNQDKAARKMLCKYVSRQIVPIMDDLTSGIDEYILMDMPETEVQFYAWLGICAKDQGNADVANAHFAVAAQICKSCGISDETKRALWNAAKAEHAAGKAHAQAEYESERSMDVESAIEQMRDSPTDPRELAAIALYEDALSDAFALLA